MPADDARHQEMRVEVAEMLTAAWREPGFCVPNPDTYPFLWLWDSCFHAVIWHELDPNRAVSELRQVFRGQDPTTGLVPHVNYWDEPDHHAGFWGRSGTSPITQPPMFGHALAVLADRVGTVPPELVVAANRGIRALLDRRRSGEALVPILHPWESGCDDSARWDDWADEHAGDGGWRRVKGELVEALVRGPSGFAVDSGRFRVPSVGFNALVAWNVTELDRIGAADADLVREAAIVAGAVRDCWDHGRQTWVDPTGTGARRGRACGRVRTADALLASLVDPRPEALASLTDPESHGGRYGVRGVHADEPSYRPDVYWRGPAWPQLDYLLWLALVRSGDLDRAAVLSRRSVDGVVRGGLAEYRNPETGAGLGAVPQSWAGLALVMDAAG